MRLESKEETTLFDISDYRGPLSTIWQIEYDSFLYDPQKDIVTIRVRAREKGAKYIHVREFEKSASGIDFKRSQVEGFVKSHFGNEWVEI